MISIARREHRELLRSALASILPAVLLTGAVAVVWTSVLDLSALHLAKTLAVLAVGAVLVLAGLPAHHPYRSIGPANQATIARGALVALLAGLIGEAAQGEVQAVATAAAVAAALLDTVDGSLARRMNMASAFGARFDMETDALLILILSILVWQFDKAGSWVVLSGLMRYGFVAAAALVSWMRRPLPASFRRKAVAALQMAALVVALAPFVPSTLSVRVAAIALFTLMLSFLSDIAWLVRHSREPAAVTQ